MTKTLVTNAPYVFRRTMALLIVLVPVAEAAAAARTRALIRVVAAAVAVAVAVAAAVDAAADEATVEVLAELGLVAVATAGTPTRATVGGDPGRHTLTIRACIL